MKILHVTNHFWPCTGGIENHTLEICKNLGDGFECGVLCLNKCSKSKNELPEEQEQEGIKIWRVDFIDFKYYKIAKKISETLNQIDFDLLHIHGLGFFSDYFLLNKKKYKKPIIISTHGGVFHTKKISFIKNIYFNIFQKKILQKADKIIAVSKNDYKIMRKILPEEKIKLIENGIGFGKFNKCNEDNKKIQNKFIFIGRIAENKKVDNLVKTFSKLNEQGVDFQLVIVGPDSGEKNKIEKIIEETGLRKKIILKGKISEEELLEEINKASFFVSAAEFEGFGLSALEGMAAGLIPILNKNESFENFIKEKGKENGFLIDFSKTKEAAEKIREITEMETSKLEKLKKNAIKKAESYSWKEKAKEFEKIYEKVRVKK